MSSLDTWADCAICPPVPQVAPWSHSPLGALVQHRVAQNHWGPCMKRRDRTLEELQPRLQLDSSCSPQPASLGRMREGKSTPAPLATWVLIAFSCRDTKYLCKQHFRILTCKCTCDTFMKYAKYDTLGYDLLCVCIWNPFPCFGSGTERFWQFVWGKQSQSVSMIHYQHIW